MSHEESGFSVGKIHGPAKCTAGACSDCDGDHHFYAESIDVDGIDPLDERQTMARVIIAAGHADAFFECKHCGAWAEMVDEDDDTEPRPTGCKCHQEAGDSACPVHDEDESPFVCPGCQAVGAQPHAAYCIDAAIELEREDDLQRSLEYDEEES